jgi:hypothetical protein
MFAIHGLAIVYTHYAIGYICLVYFLFLIGEVYLSSLHKPDVQAKFMGFESIETTASNDPAKSNLS